MQSLLRKSPRSLDSGATVLNRFKARKKPLGSPSDQGAFVLGHHTVSTDLIITNSANLFACFSAKSMKGFSTVESGLVAVSIGRLEALKRAENLDDDCPRPPEWMHDLSSPQSRRTPVEVYRV